MKALKKLALVSAVSMISAGAFAMEAMDDESMSAATGQDGITILIAPGAKTGTQLAALGVSDATMASIDVAGVVNNGATQGVGTNGAFKGLSIRQVVIHDDDGWVAANGGTAGTTDNSGAIVIGNGNASDSTVVFADDTTPISVLIDAVGDHDNNGTDSAMLNVRISTPTLAIKVGSVSVADSNAVAGATTATDTDGTAYDNDLKIMNDMTLILGATTINVQLGNETQGGMIAVNAAITGGLTINNLSLNDVNSGGSITASSLKLIDATAAFADGTNLTANVIVNAVSTIGGADTLGGLVVALVGLGGAGGVNMTLNDQFLGNATAANQDAANLGDIQIKGLDLAGTQLIIRGH